MSKLILSTLAAATVLTGLIGASALAQLTLTPQGVPPGDNPETGARPGNVIGTGMSLPMSTKAGNLNLPTPAVGENASVADLLRAARGALAAGRTGEAQQALEMAQTRLLDRSVPLGQTNSLSDNPVVQQIAQARQALLADDRPTCMRLIEAAIPAVSPAN